MVVSQFVRLVNQQQKRSWVKQLKAELHSHTSLDHRVAREFIIFQRNMEGHPVKYFVFNGVANAAELS